MKTLILLLVVLAFTACGPELIGPPGPKGPTGAAGQAGVAPSMVPIQLCPQQVIQYPSSFPESALCIEGKLYGVMWNGTSAWLAELPPGNYASTSPSGCNLHIGANCQVTN